MNDCDCDFELVRVPRSWVGERLWKQLCKGNLVTWEPFYTVFTTKPGGAECDGEDGLA